MAQNSNQSSIKLKYPKTIKYSLKSVYIHIIYMCHLANENLIIERDLYPKRYLQLKYFTNKLNGSSAMTATKLEMSMLVRIYVLSSDCLMHIPDLGLPVY